MATARKSVDIDVHAILTAKREIILIKPGGSKSDALTAARKDERGKEGALLYATFSEGEAKKVNRHVEQLTVAQVSTLARRCFEIIPAQKRAA